jgi:uncharacterized protein
MDKEDIIAKTVVFAKEKLSGEGTGHDWFHVQRVWKTTKYLAKKEGADVFVAELAALLHDIADWKFNGGDETEGARVSRAWLESLGVEEDIIKKVTSIVEHSSYKGKQGKKLETLEGLVMQDADRLDAIGAVGIARVFAYGGSLAREIYNPAIAPIDFTNAEQYKNNTSTPINHFYEKLLLLKDLMNTATGRKLAQEKHAFMEKYLLEFYKEWECNYE